MKFKIVTCQIILLNLLLVPCFGQVLSLGLGQMFYNSKTIVPVVNQYESSNNKPYYSLDLTIIEKNRSLIGIELSSGSHHIWDIL